MKTNCVHAQLWRYLNDSPEKERAAEKDLEKEASSVITKKTVAYGDTFSYKIMTYAIKSFDGGESKIRLWEKPFDGHVFHIDCPGEKLMIVDFQGLEKIHFLTKNLLEIVYSPRGGSDQGFDNVLILGINKGKFVFALDMLCINEFDGPGEYGLYNLHLKLSGQNPDNYQIAVNVRDLLKSNNKAKKSYDRSNNYILKFDKELHVFFNYFKLIDPASTQWSSEAKKTLSRQAKGNYPSIKVDGYEYCFLGGLWYSYTKNAKGKYDLFPNTEWN